MFSTKFWLTFGITLAALLFSFAGVVIMAKGTFWDWFWVIWIRVLCVAAGIDFSLVFYIGWDYLNPTETRLPFYVALGASLIIALGYIGLTLLLK
jgi:hypothetical protein